MNNNVKHDDNCDGVVVNNQNLIGLRLMLTTDGSLVSLTNLPSECSLSIVLTNEL